MFILKALVFVLLLHLNISYGLSDKQDYAPAIKQLSDLIDDDKGDISSRRQKQCVTMTQYQQFQQQVYQNFEDLQTSVHGLQVSIGQANSGIQSLDVHLMEAENDLQQLDNEVANIIDQKKQELCLFYVPVGGGGGGHKFTDWQRFMNTSPRVIKGFIIRYGSGIDCFGLLYDTVHATCHGGSGGEGDLVLFDDDEFITSISGRAADRIDQLTIKTNKADYGPYGGNGGDEFQVGFFNKRVAFISGSGESRLDSLGLHLYC